MEINILYSQQNANHIRTASFVKEAVKNLGISARITERETKMAVPRVMVNGFDLIKSIKEKTRDSIPRITYDLIEKALEETAWVNF